MRKTPKHIKYLFIFMLSGCASSGGFMFPGEPGDNKGQVYEKKQRPLVYSPESIARMGMVYEGMPEDKLIEAGYTPGLLIQRRKENNAEFLTYTEYSTEEQGDTVTFVVRDGVVKSWFTEPAGDN